MEMIALVNKAAIVSVPRSFTSQVARVRVSKPVLFILWFSLLLFLCPPMSSHSLGVVPGPGGERCSGQGEEVLVQPGSGGLRRGESQTHRPDDPGGVCHRHQ